MDRRLLSLALLAAACSGKHAPVREAVPVASADAAGQAAVAPAPPPIAAVAAEPDAAPEEEPTPPIKPADVLSGAAAEQVIAELKEAKHEPPAPDAPELRIYPSGVGPYELGMTRREVAELLGRRGRFTRVHTAPGEVSVELADLLVGPGLIFMRMKIYGGRVSEISVLGPDARARTDGGIMVGATFDDALLAHGDATRRGRGYVLSDLPGVLFVPADPAVLNLPTPPPAAKVGSMIVVGPEGD